MVTPGEHLRWHAVTASCSALAHLVSRMTLQEKVAQITQLDINEILDHEAARRGALRLDPDKVDAAISAGVGSFLNSPTAGGPQGKLDVPTAAQWRDALSYLETAYINAGKVHLCPPRPPPSLSCLTAAAHPSDDVFT